MSYLIVKIEITSFSKLVIKKIMHTNLHDKYQHLHDIIYRKN